MVLSYCIAVSGLTTVVEELFRLWWYCHIVLLYLVTLILTESVRLLCYFITFTPLLLCGVALGLSNSKVVF